MDLAKTPSYQPRRFVPEGIDLTDVDKVVRLYQKLNDRDISSAQDLEAFLLDRSELDGVFDQQKSILYIGMTCQTDDSSRAEAYRKFIETVMPAVEPLTDQLDRKYLDANRQFPLDAKRYEVYSRAVHADVELFRQQNVPLRTQEKLLSQEYQKICAAMTVSFQGKEYTLPQMRKFLEKPDRSLRQSAWQACAARRLKDANRMEEVFDKMLSLRRQIAANADCDNYRDYIFRAYHRFDYTAADCKDYHRAVENLVVPLLREILAHRAQQMNLSKLRPWDLEVDSKGQPPLEPFDRVDRFISGISEVFDRIDPQLSGQFGEMIRLGLLDLDSRKGKAPGGYQVTLNEARKPFIFMNAVGINSDLRTLLHEAGHAFHALACADDPLLAYRHSPIEFCEVASMSMELLAGPHLSVFYNQQQARRSGRDQLEGIIQVLAWIATIDAFQHWLYENPDHTGQDRCRAWRKIHNTFGGQLVDWSGLEQQHEYLWHKQLHIFQYPFYYIEYAIAQLGALGLWQQSRKDKCAALANYRKALALGGSKSLPELFLAAGLKFDFSENAIAPLIDAVAEQWAKLKD